MNEKVKEKRYFIDYMLSNSGLSTKQMVLIPVLPLIIGFIIAGIYYFINVDKFGYEINSYSKEKVERIEDICDIFITEGSRFDLSYIPEDVKNYNVEYDGDEIKLHYCLKDANDLKYAPSLYMDVTLSKDLQIIDMSQSYTSEEEYVRSTKTSIYVNVFFIIGFALVPICILVSYFPFSLIGMLISYIHKRIDLSRKWKEETEG